MSIVKDIKKAASSNGTKIQTSYESELEQKFNKMFFLEKNIEEETAFIKQVMTRGLETTERYGLHASAIIESDSKFCVRQQVLSLMYKQIQGDNVSVPLKRIFEEGNAIHEKWQRMFIRAGYAKAKNLDRSRFNEQYELSYTPDIMCRIPLKLDKEKEELITMVGEIKSVNTYQFKNMTSHPSGKKQMQFYMWLTGVHKGFVLCDDKNTQEFKVFLYDFDMSIVAPFIERLEMIQFYKERALNEHKMVNRHEDCKSVNCKKAQECPMRDACYGTGIGKVLLPRYSKGK
jgi:hypothetical protein